MFSLNIFHKCKCKQNKETCKFNMNIRNKLRVARAKILRNFTWKIRIFVLKLHQHYKYNMKLSILVHYIKLSIYFDLLMNNLSLSISTQRMSSDHCCNILRTSLHIKCTPSHYFTTKNLLYHTNICAAQIIFCSLLIFSYWKNWY